MTDDTRHAPAGLSASPGDADGRRGRFVGGPGTQTAHRRADMVEVDVVPTADGTLVTFHDNGLAERDGGERGLTDTEGLVFETDTDRTNATVLGTVERSRRESVGTRFHRASRQSRVRTPGATTSRSPSRCRTRHCRRSENCGDPTPNARSTSSASTTRDTRLVVRRRGARDVREATALPVAFLFGPARGGAGGRRRYDCER